MSFGLVYKLKLFHLMSEMLFVPIKYFINIILKFLNVFVIYRIGNAIGDQVCITGYIRLLSEQSSVNIWIVTNKPEIFLYNHRVSCVFDINNVPIFMQYYVKLILYKASGNQIEQFVFRDTMNGLDWTNYLKTTLSDDHMIKLHSQHFKKKISYDYFKNEFIFSDEEVDQYTKKYQLPKKYSVIHSESKTLYASNKQWSPKKYQEIVDYYREIIWIQVGLCSEVKLNNCIDLRGMTSIRELAFIISKSSFIVSTEGLYNHIASSFNCKSFVIYTGISKTNLTSYTHTIPISIMSRYQCAPCYLKHNCNNIEKNSCSKNLKSNIAIGIINQYLESPTG